MPAGAAEGTCEAHQGEALVMVAVWRVYMIVVLQNIFGRLVLAHGEVLHSGLPALLLGQWHCACFGWIPPHLLLFTAHWEELCAVAKL